MQNLTPVQQAYYKHFLKTVTFYTTKTKMKQINTSRRLYFCEAYPSAESSSQMLGTTINAV